MTRREHSRHELTDKLRARGHPADEIEQALARLTQEDWQSDARFAESLTRHRAASGYGPRWIRAELLTHRLDSMLVESALMEFAGDWNEIARELLTRRGLGPSEEASPLPAAHHSKGRELLMRRGFEKEMVVALLDE